MSDKIFVIGDSHVNFFSGNEYINWTPMFKNDNPTYIGMMNNLIVNFIPLHLGGALAYNLNKYGTTTQAREKIDLLFNAGIIPEGSKILCAFGEIDCRTHVLKQAIKNNIPIKIVVNNILNNYAEFIKFLSTKAIVYVWGPIASGAGDEILLPPDHPYPYFGKEVERNLATKYFNDGMKILCPNIGAKFISIFYNLIDENYKTRTEFIADGCHLSQKAWIFAMDIFSREGITIRFTEEWLRQFLKRNISMQIAINKIQNLCKNYGGAD